MTIPLHKQPSESRIYYFQFGANLSSGETLLDDPAPTIAVVPPDELTISAVGIDATGKKVQFRIASGNSATKYVITCVAQTSLGNTLEEEGDLYVEDE
jgi:hypothetical protein